jgi:preprotein translocase subunit SecG
MFGLGLQEIILLAVLVVVVGVVALVLVRRSGGTSG